MPRDWRAGWASSPRAGGAAWGWGLLAPVVLADLGSPVGRLLEHGLDRLTTAPPVAALVVPTAALVVATLVVDRSAGPGTRATADPTERQALFRPRETFRTMSDGLFTRDVLLDISVNVVPIVIIAAFLALFLAYAPWGEPLSLAWFQMVGLHVVPIASLAYLTYEAARRIETGGEPE